MENLINNTNHFYFFFRHSKFRIVNLKSDNTEIMMGIETDYIINEPFESSLKKCQEGLEKKMRWSDFFNESFDLCY